MFPRLESFSPKAFLAAALLAMAGCETAPVQEMSDARQAIAVAREAGAAEHAPVPLKAAVDYLENAERSLSERDYAAARRDALQAKDSALTALQQSELSHAGKP